MKKTTAKKTVADKTAGTKKRKESSGIILSVIALVVITFVVFSPCFKAGFTNWDDKRYIFETPAIQNLKWENIKAIFSEKILLSYNPLVVLSFAVDYSFVGQNASWYHTFNVLLHILNSVLLLFIVRRLTGRQTIAVITAFLFALHPMHVESVAWVASRKDVLFTLFYFLSWLFYLKSFIPARNRMFYFLSLFAFVLSLLSKSQAVTLPLVLLMSRWLFHKRWDKKYLFDLIPFFMLSIAIGYFTLQGAAASADKYAAPLTFLEKIWYSIIAAGIYLYKSILPFNQSAIYAFPESGSQEFITGLAMGLAILTAVIWVAWKYRDKIPSITWGIAFFLLHIFLILHILATNSSLIYERFTYVSYVGIFFALASLYDVLPADRQNTVRIIFIVALGVFSVAAYSRCEVWKNTEALWTDVIEKNPMSDAAFNNRGENYYKNGEFEKALADFTACIRIKPNQPNPYNNRSIIYLAQKRYADALADNAKALQLEPDFPAAYNNKGNIYYNMGSYDSALVAFSNAIKQSYNFPSAWCNRGSAYLQKGNFQEAIKNYRKAMELSPNYDEAFRFMGIAYMRMDRLDTAYAYFSKAQQLNPQSNALKVLTDEYLKRGSAAFTKNNIDDALSWYAKAAEVNPDEAEAYYCIGGAWFAKGDAARAREFWRRTLQLNPGHKEAQMWLGRVGQQ